ncbi:unnamed protein product [Chilo suppressalis]|uniref:Arrestin C-terminal-like domain-containing protein n=1 Tax=Chilo suppressalis TaxID=168631 RepID=A0ABN8ATS3_CHISP|nr:unnamed protein product [Chilo suppressalis]
MDVGFNNGDIKLNSNNNVYYSGQTITGDITFRLLDLERITGLNIQYLGTAKVLWTEIETEKRNGTKFKNKVEYKSQEQYFNKIECLVGGQGVTELKSGQHSIAFEFQIPATVPSSFRSDKGEIIYEIRAYLEFPDVTKARGELVKIFEVVAPFDLNKEDPRINQPLKIFFEEEYGCDCLFKPGVLAVEAEAAAAAACPGQCLPVQVRAKNDANFEIRYVRLQLLSKQRFRSQYPIAESSNPDEELASVKTGPVMTGVKRNYQLCLQMPDIIAPNLTNCSIIHVEYTLQVTVKLSGLHSDLIDSSPFFIGLKPFSDFGKGPYVHPMAHSLPSGPIPDYVPSQPTTNPVQRSEIGFVESIPSPAILNQSFVSQQPNCSQYPGTGYNYNQSGYSHPNQPVPGYPNPPIPGYPTQPVSGYPHQPVSGYPIQPVTVYPGNYPVRSPNSSGYSPSAPSI